MSDFNSSPSDAIAVGICVILSDDGEIIYAGPISAAPGVAGKLVLMNPKDFEMFKKFVAKRRH